MVFLETPSFTRAIKALLSEKEYLRLQAYLIERPDAGDLIRGSHGLRKLRWRTSGRGKRGGARIIYYFAPSRQEDLDRKQLSQLRKIVEVWTNG